MEFDLLLSLAGGFIKSMWLHMWVFGDRASFLHTNLCSAHSTTGLICNVLPKAVLQKSAFRSHAIQ